MTDHERTEAPSKSKDLWDTDEVAAHFGVSSGAIRRWMREDASHPLWRARVEPGGRTVRFRRKVVEEIGRRKG